MQTSDFADPLEYFGHAHQKQLEICMLLEHIADSLPDRVDRQHCFQVANFLRSEFAFHQADEELGLFPLLRQHCNDVPGLCRSLERMEEEHMDDEGFADEIIDALDNLVRGAPQHVPETFAYMLRGFFACLRRHIAFENEVLLPAARRCLDAVQRQTLVAVMQSNRSVDMTRLFPQSPCVSAKTAILRALGTPSKQPKEINRRRLQP